MERTSFQRGNVSPTIFDWPDDVLLFWFIVTRDEGILGEFVKRHKQMVLDVCQRVLHHRQDAEDAAQETFCVLWRIRPSIRKRKSLKSWLCGTAVRVARKVRKSKQRGENRAKPRELAKLLNRNRTSTVFEWPDEVLLSWFVKTHDEGIFAEFVKRHERMVQDVCRRVLRHGQDAEDASQQTFRVLWENTASIRKVEALKSWLHGVAFRMAGNAQKKRKRREHHESQSDAAQVADVAQAADEVEFQEFETCVAAEIQRLPEKYRAPFVLHRLEGRSRAETAAELGLKKGTVASRVRRARELLQQQLAQRGIVAPSYRTANGWR